MRFLKQYGFDIFLIILLAIFFTYSEIGEFQITNEPKTVEESPALDDETITKTQESEGTREEPEESELSSDISEPIEPPAQETSAPKLPTITQETNDFVRNAAVNILCTSKSSGSFSPISGSGVIIDPSGVILTNAHIAQYFLLENYRVEGFIECVIRNGNPAKNQFTAKLLYLPEAWIESNKEKITSSNPEGTGENDFAFLLIDGTTNPNNQLPSQFPFVPVDASNSAIRKGVQALVAGYPAGFLGGITISKSLPLVSTIVTIEELYTFTENLLDVLSLGGSIIAQSGSSGSPVVTGDKKIQGIIVTSTQEDTTDARNLGAVTTGHINRSLIKFTGENFAEFLSGNLTTKADVFNKDTTPSLTQALIDEIEK